MGDQAPTMNRHTTTICIDLQTVECCNAVPVDSQLKPAHHFMN